MLNDGIMFYVVDVAQKHKLGFTPAGDFRHPDICFQEQEEGSFTQYGGFFILKMQRNADTTGHE